MFSNIEQGKSEIISELFNLFSLIVSEEAFLEDQKSLLADNETFYPETAFTYMAHFQNFIKHSIKRISDESQNINIFDPNFIDENPLEVKEKKIITYENLLIFFEFNDLCDIEKNDLENFKNYYFASPEKGLDYQSFINILLPHSNKSKKKACLKRKILYELSNLESMKMDWKLQSLIAQIFEDEIFLFKRAENIKIKLINKYHWDPIDAFNNLDQNAKGFLNFDSLEIMFKNFDQKLSPKDFKSILRRINKDSEAETIYFEDFKRLVLPFNAYFTSPDKILHTSLNFSKSQVYMERVDQSVNDDKYLILKSTMKNEENYSNINSNSPIKIRQAIFSDSVIDNKSPMIFSSLTSHHPSKTKNTLVVSSLLNSSQKPIQENDQKKTLYVAKNDLAGNSQVYSRFPSSKIIQDLHGEHKFMNLKTTNHGPTNLSPKEPIKPISQKINPDHLVYPITNFDNDLKNKPHEKKIYTPMRQNPQLMLSLSNEFAMKTQNLHSPLNVSKTRKPVFYSSTKEIEKKNLDNLKKTENLRMSNTMNQSFLSSKKKIFENKELQKSGILNTSFNVGASKSPQKLAEPEVSRRTLIENNINKNVSKPTPPLII